MPNQIEKGFDAIAAGVMGVMKAAKGKLTGLTGVFAHLTREHGKVTALLLRTKASSDPELRALLFPKIRADLLSHEKGELSEVYPVFSRFAELAPFAERHDRDADKLETLLDELSSMPYTDARWPERFAKLVDSVDRHATEEENEFFPLASKVIGPKESEAMLRRYEPLRDRLMKSMSPKGEAAAAKSPPKRKPASKHEPVTVRTARAAHRVATRRSPKKAAAPSRAKAKRSSAKTSARKLPAAKKPATKGTKKRA